MAKLVKSTKDTRLVQASSVTAKLTQTVQGLMTEASTLYYEANLRGLVKAIEADILMEEEFGLYRRRRK